MTVEIRYIAFTPNEVVRAVADYRRRRGKPLPVGPVTGLDVYASPAIEVSLKIAHPERGDERTVAVRAEQLAAALVLYCISSRIPVPARAQKTLFAGRDGGVVLGYAMGLSSEDQPTFATAVPPIVAVMPQGADPDAEDAATAPQA